MDIIIGNYQQGSEEMLLSRHCPVEDEDEDEEVAAAASA